MSGGEGIAQQGAANTRMAIIDIIKRFFSLGEVGFSVPARLGRDRMAGCVQEARQIAETARRKQQEARRKETRDAASGIDFCDPAFDPNRKSSEVLKAIDLDYDASGEAKELGCPIPSPPVEPPRRVPPNLHAAVLSFSARLLTYVNEKCDGVAPMAYKRAGVSRQVYSRIVSFDDSAVDKQTAMLFCIGLQLTMSEAELLLKSAGYAFSDTIPTDMLFSFCIKQKIWNLKDVNALFARCKLPPVTRSRNPYK